MALIASYITKFGIIQLSDFKQIIDEGGAGNGQKIFPIPHLNASLVFSGSYSINGVAIGTWMKNFIEWSQLYLTTINDFSFHLYDKMNKEMREDEKKAITEVYIAGYQINEFYMGSHQITLNGSHPEHWTITNARRNGDDYYSSLAYFHDHNNFNSWEIPYHSILLKEMNHDPLKHQVYINGFPRGKIGNNRAMIVKDKTDELLKYILKREDLRFRRPDNLSEFSNVARLYFSFITELLKMDDSIENYPGGEIHIHEIPASSDLWKG